MCGRYSLTADAAILAEQFAVGALPDVRPRYNIAPSQPVLVVWQGTEAGRRAAGWRRWGLIPSWAKDPQVGQRMINARVETAAEKPAFRKSFRTSRCLILADGFYEWQVTDEGKRPFYIRLRDGRPFAFAGLWDRWQGATGAPVESCAIVTMEANEALHHIHNRMPVILPPDAYRRWLDLGEHRVTALRALLRPYPASAIEHYRVGSFVNDPRHESPDCMKLVET